MDCIGAGNAIALHSTCVYTPPVCTLHQCVHSTSVYIPPVCTLHQCVHSTSVYTPPVCTFHLYVHSTSVYTPPVCTLHQCVHSTSVYFPLQCACTSPFIHVRTSGCPPSSSATPPFDEIYIRTYVYFMMLSTAIDCVHSIAGWTSSKLNLSAITNCVCQVCTHMRYSYMGIVSKRPGAT